MVIQFIDNTQPTPTDWIWDFGDGDITNSTVRNPLHTYTRNGTFSVTLSVKNNNGLWNSTTIADYITVTSSPSTPANFTANPQSRIAGAPLKVQFIDRSTNVPNEWLWNFGDGDGTNATKKHPIHTYTKNGTFTVTLTATNWSTGSSGFTRTGYITVGPLYAETFRPYMVLIFNRTGSTKWLPPAGITKVDYLVVGGGGEGGNGCNVSGAFYPGGGGGAGGVRNGTSFTVNGEQNIVIGAGGSGAGNTVGRGLNGGNSVFGAIISVGGGGGGGCGGAGSSGGDGGSGGGGCGMGSPGGAGNVTAGQGNSGGTGNYTLGGHPAGGGGGAGAPGSLTGDLPPDVTTGDGGIGKSVDITGATMYYGSGGGGGIGSNASYGNGGAGCGADGSRGNANPAKCQGTGAGGGGAGGGNPTHGAGGSGVVIIRYQTPETMPLAANFSATPTSGSNPMTVTFTDLSTGAPTSWLWDFGDNDPTNATMKNPIHTYDNPGTYTVKLNVTDSYSSLSDMTVKTNFIAVCNPDMIGVYRPENRTFYLRAGTQNITTVFGTPTDRPITGDWNGDGIWEVGVFPSTNNTFYLKNGSQITSFPYGLKTDIPISGDWNGDGLWEVGLFRPSTGTFFLRNGTITTSFVFGTSTDRPIAGDWNSDGLWDVGVFPTQNNTFYLRNGTQITSFHFGLKTDLPMSGDWNGDGLSEVGLFRNSTGVFYLQNGTTTTILYGAKFDLPVSGKWI